MSISTYTLYSDAAVETALDAVGGQMMGTQDTELLKQIFVAAGNGSGGGGAYLPTAGGTMTGDIVLGDGVNILTNGTTGSTFGASGGKLSFFEVTPIERPVVTGNRSDPESALADLLTKLASIGIIVDSTDP